MANSEGHRPRSNGTNAERHFVPRDGERLGGGTVDIHDRTFAFAVRILKLVRALPGDAAGRTMSRQLARSGTSVGANVEEAQSAQSRAEFARKMTITRSEARETLYWIRLIAASEILPADQLQELKGEAGEIARILTSIVKNTRKPKKQADTADN